MHTVSPVLNHDNAEITPSCETTHIGLSQTEQSVERVRSAPDGFI